MNQYYPYPQILDEVLFGEKRILLVEQISCIKHNEIRRGLVNKRLSAAIKEAAEKIHNSKMRNNAASWVVISEAGRHALDSVMNFSGDTD